MQLDSLDEAVRAQRALAAVSELLIGNDDLHCVNRDHLSMLLGLIAEELDQCLTELEQIRCNRKLKAVIGGDHGHHAEKTGGQPSCAGNCQEPSPGGERGRDRHQACLTNGKSRG